MCDILTAPVTEGDIKAEFSALPINKSPGPDGYTSEFFKGCWGVVGGEITSAVKEFFSSGQILHQWNTTAISLIPKKENANKIQDFRPISCCNVVYKVISKILARRLQALLPLWISPAQSAFVKGRLLTENVLLASELIQGFGHANASKRGLLKVDLKKAFDSIHWDFILEALHAAGFPPVFVNWISQCISTTTFSVNINGNLHGYFRGTNGLRQGDPLSPSLFVIAMDFFNRLLSKSFDDGLIGFHPMARCLRISSILFADDLMVFYDGRPGSLGGILSVLEEFRAISGLGMNIEKTSIYTAGLTNEEIVITNSHGFLRGTFPFRYLGLPLLHRKLRISDYSPLLDHLRTKFNHWTTKVLSFAGRLQLIKSVVFSMVNFWISVFPLPKGCLKTIESLCNRFLWTGDINRLGGIKVAWEQVCFPKSEGGLGLRNLWIWNKVLNLRLIWQLFTSSGSLWVAWIKAYHLRKVNFWIVNINSRSSWLWKSILSLRPMAKRFLCCNIKDGKTASFWHDNWTNLGPLIDHVGTDGPRLMGLPIHSTVCEAVNNLTGEWIVPSPRARVPGLETLRNVLTNTPVPNVSLGMDKFLWNVEGNSIPNFSSKLTWNICRPIGTIKAWSRDIWFKGYVPKHAFMFWVAHLDRLPLRTRLLSWGIHVSDTCCLCGQVSETRDHLFFQCDFSKSLWDKIRIRLGITNVLLSEWNNLLVCMSSTCLPNRTLNRLVSQTTVYNIWKEMNNRLHNVVSLPMTVVFNMIDRSVRDSILGRLHQRKFKHLLSIWFAND